MPTDLSPAPSPLAGLIVADFSRALAGPYATMMLGDLGAEVIKVERPGEGDEVRGWGPPFLDGESAYYLALNRNKRSIVLDLTSAVGRRTATALAARADVVVENFRPGTMARLGLSYAEVAASNPGVVYCSISGFGAGAGARLPGYDFLVQAVGGLMSLTGPDEATPTKVGIPVVDILAGLHATVGIQAALAHRDKTGQGQLVEVNLLSSLLAALTNQASNYLTAGLVARPMGNRHPSITPYELLAAADRPLAVAVANDRQFRALCGVLTIPAVATDPRFATNSARVAHRGELIFALEVALRSKPAADWVELLTAVGVPAGVVNTVAEAFDLATDLGLAPIAELFRPEGRSVPTTASPVTLSATPVSYRRHPPRLGEHTEAIAAELAAGVAAELAAGVASEPASGVADELAPADDSAAPG